MKYTKPEFFAEEFALNQSIALCKPEEVTKSTTVHCLKTNKHEIFEKNCSTKYSVVDDGLITYNGQQYLVWGQRDGANIECPSRCPDCNDSNNNKIFNAIVRAGLAGSMDHIAPVTGELKYLINMSQ